MAMKEFEMSEVTAGASWYGFSYVRFRLLHIFSPHFTSSRCTRVAPLSPAPWNSVAEKISPRERKRERISDVGTSPSVIFDPSRMRVLQKHSAQGRVVSSVCAA